MIGIVDVQQFMLTSIKQIVNVLQFCVLIAVLQCNRDGKFRSDALFGFHADGPVHHLNDPFRDG